MTKSASHRPIAPLAFGVLTRASTRVSYACAAIAICQLALCGCDKSNTAIRPAQVDHTPGWEIPVIAGKELRRFVQQSDGPVLVEFGVAAGCVRCDDMRPQLGHLAGEFEGRAKLIRVDFNANRRLVAQYGGNICPTYVLFNHGKPVVTRSYPTSTDLLAADLDAAAALDQD